MRGFDLGQIRFDEEADGNAAIPEQGHDLLDTIFVAGYVQAAFSREFLTLFRDERDHIWFYRQGNFGHRFIGGHLQIKLGANEFPQEAKIAVLNVTPIFSEVDDNTVSPGQFNQHCGGKGIRVCSTAGLAQGGHMVNVHPKSWHGSSVLAMWSKEKISCVMSANGVAVVTEIDWEGQGLGGRVDGVLFQSV